MFQNIKSVRPAPRLFLLLVRYQFWYNKKPMWENCGKSLQGFGCNAMHCNIALQCIVTAMLQHPRCSCSWKADANNVDCRGIWNPDTTHFLIRWWEYLEPSFPWWNTDAVTTDWMFSWVVRVVVHLWERCQSGVSLLELLRFELVHCCIAQQRRALSKGIRTLQQSTLVRAELSLSCYYLEDSGATRLGRR